MLYFTSSRSSNLFMKGLILIRAKPSCCSPLLCPFQYPFVRWVSNGISGGGAVEFLVNSCGLSQESAERAAKKLSFKGSQRPEAVVRLLQGEGFSNGQVSEFVRKQPRLLSWDPDKCLKPKIDFYKGLGLPSSDLARILSVVPELLLPSLKNHLIPWVDFLRNLVGEDGLVRALRQWPYILITTKPKVMTSNIEILRGHGVPAEKVANVIVRAPRVLLCSSHKFKETVGKVVEMGFSPSRHVFLYALEAMISKKRWEEKMEAYRSLGWSDEQIILAFKKQPMIFRTSVKKINKLMSFFADEMGCGPSVISMCPNLMLLSLERRIVPRYRVLEMLMAKGLIKHDWHCSAICINDKNFLARFVAKYQNEAPELLKLYQVRGEKMACP